MEITHHEHEITIVLPEQFDYSSATQLLTQTRGDSRYSSKDIRIDFSQTHHVDSAGIGVLVSMHVDRSDFASKITCTHVADKIKGLFIKYGLDRFFNIS